MVAVKKFSAPVQVAKIEREKISRAQTARALRVCFRAFNFRRFRRWRKLNAEIYHAKIKERENFPIYGIYYNIFYTKKIRKYYNDCFICCLVVYYCAFVLFVHFYCTYCFILFY